MEIFDLEQLSDLQQIEIFGNYMGYVEMFRKVNYSDEKPVEFEDYLWSDYFKCNNCNEWKNIDDKGTTELALTDNICENCMKEGYGK